MKKSKNKLIFLIVCLLLTSTGCTPKQSVDSSNSKPNSSISKVGTKESSKEISSLTEKDPPKTTLQTLSPNNVKIETSTEQNSSPNPTAASPPAKYEPSDKPNAKPIYIGTTKEEFLSIMGGSGVTLLDFGVIYVFMRNTASIFMNNDNGTIKVIGWDNIGNVFNVSAGEKDPSAPPVTLGSSKEDVRRAMGSPYHYGIPYSQNPNTLKYTLTDTKRTQWRFPQDSFVTFDNNGKVVGWYNTGDLKVSYGVKNNSALPVKLGSPLEDVLGAFGTPLSLVPYNNSNITEDINYNICRFTFDQNSKVNGWTNKGADKINMGNKNLSAPSFKVGSSMEEVINAMGTPDKVEQNFNWSYGYSEVKFDSNWTVISYLNTGNLKID